MVARLEVEVDRIFLDQENPRHKPYDTQSEVIEYLCTHESILSLARDIAANGLNPCMDGSCLARLLLSRLMNWSAAAMYSASLCRQCCAP